MTLIGIGVEAGDRQIGALSVVSKNTTLDAGAICVGGPVRLLEKLSPSPVETG